MSCCHNMLLVCRFYYYLDLRRLCLLYKSTLFTDCRLIAFTGSTSANHLNLLMFCWFIVGLMHYFLSYYSLRYQKDKGEYRLTLSYRAEPKHYIISYKNKMYFIENGPNFESLIEVGCTSIRHSLSVKFSCSESQLCLLGWEGSCFDVY